MRFLGYGEGSERSERAITSESRGIWSIPKGSPSPGKLVDKRSDRPGIFFYKDEILKEDEDKIRGEDSK